MATKHEKIIKHIESLPIGEKISVRLIAKAMDVSEGTAYRAIKDAENHGLVSTIQRVGTIRIEKKRKEAIKNLTFSEVLSVIEGEVLGGEKGLQKTLTKFIIGAMKEEAMVRYISKESLMIVGNREEAQRLALENGAAVLITGGFGTEKEIIDLANGKELPLMTTSYDTFTVAAMINRAMTDQLIKKEIMLTEDIYTKLNQTEYLSVDDTVDDYRKLNEASGHTRFPIVGKSNRLVGIVTAKDVIGKQDKMKIDRVMTRNPYYVKTHMSVASVAHTMIWDGLEVMPVVKDDLTLKGIISRQDVMKAMQSAQRQPQMGDTIADQINRLIKVPEETMESSETMELKFSVTPQMTNNVGTISFGVLSEVVSESAYKALASVHKRNLVVEQMSLHYFKLIQFGAEITIIPKIFDIGRKSARMDIELYSENGLAAKAIVVCQLIQKN
ncbi:DRTGG domain-containing protein [Lacticigenium naphthae]|uniref:DRTGG domain-containing protein n=1 Tax=Lacticigenium naphthae TaxID=515351 RepID=UPI0004087772|nr:DRTGG domain-containing protein [Lacticigenium naphthae]